MKSLNVIFKRLIKWEWGESGVDCFQLHFNRVIDRLLFA